MKSYGTISTGSIGLFLPLYAYDPTSGSNAPIPLTASFSCTTVYSGIWSTGGSMITARDYLAGAGTQNAALAFGGSIVNGARVACTEAYNGSTWTAGGALIVARDALGGAGTQNAALAFGGLAPPNATSCTEAYNGSTWTAGGALINARRLLAGVGTQNEALAFGGFVNAAVSCTEAYNGSTWAAGGALIQARYYVAGAGTQTAALAFGGADPGFDYSCTEEYTVNPFYTKSIQGI